jgi:hypothetical protein
MKSKLIPSALEYGLYVWVTDDGKLVQDAEGHVMCIASLKDNKEKIAAITKAASHYGVPGGRPIFLPGQRKITDEEYEEQKARLEAGLIPDPYDVDAWAEEEGVRQIRGG